MNKTSNKIKITTFLFLIQSQVMAEIIDPEELIKKNGYQNVTTTADGMKFYSYSEMGQNPTHIAQLEQNIAALPKHKDVLSLCNTLRDTIKEDVSKQYSQSIDVSINNYGYNGSVVACSMKLITGSSLNKHLLFMKTVKSESFTLTVGD